MNSDPVPERANQTPAVAVPDSGSPPTASASAVPLPAGKPPRRIPWFLIAVAVLGVALAAYGLRGIWVRYTAPEPPEVDLNGIDHNVARAITSARDAVRRNPTSAEAWGMLGKVLRAHEYYMEADTCFDRAEELDPHDARWPYFLSRGSRGKDPDKALVYVRGAVERCGEVSAPRLVLAELLLDKGSVADAEFQLLEVLQNEPGNPRAQLGMARVAISRNDLPKALAHLQRSAKEAPAVKATHALLVEVYRRQGNDKAAEQESKAMIPLSNNWVWPDPYLDEVRQVWVGLKAGLWFAEELHTRGRDDEALKHLRILIRDYPDDHKPYLSVGQTLNRLGKSREAEPILRTAARLAPDKGVIHFELGYALQHQGRNPEAAECYRTAIRLQPNLALAHFNLSFLLRTVSDLSGALRELRETVRYQPDFAPAYKQLGDLLAHEGKYVAALEELKRGAKLAPEDESIRKLLDRVRAELARSRKP